MNKTHGWKLHALDRIRPDGWIRDFLLHQRDGLTGHLEVAGYPFHTKGWLVNHIPLGERGGSGWWPYEQYAYWIDGMIRAGILLGDDFLRAKARRQIDHVLNHPDADGYLGPDAMKTLNGTHGSERWPHAVFLRAVLADYDERPNKQTLKILVRHFLSKTALHETNRNVCNIEIMVWLYEQTGDKRMLDLALTSFRNWQKNEVKDGATLKNMLSGKRFGDHGPRHMELFKLGAVLYRVTGNREFLKASLNANRKLKRDHVLIDGVPSSTEHMRGIYSTAGHETCVITDYLWSLGFLLQATGDASIADDMEKICFNALPGAVTEDFRALQYFSGPNQVIAGPQTNHHPHGHATTHISFRPNPATECCPGNVHRAMPAFAGRMWMDDAKGGIVAALYGPSKVTIGKGKTAVTIHEETNYPFEDQIRFRFICKSPAKFAFTFRIPGWCKKPAVSINGERLKQKFASGKFATLKRTFKNGDVIELNLPREVRLSKGPENGVGLEWGPLVMSLGIEEKRSIVEEDKRSSPEFPAWTMEPASPWNYVLALDKNGKLPPVQIEKRLMIGNPWTAENAPIRIIVPARKVPGWKLKRMKKLVMKHGEHTRVHTGNIIFMPALPDEETLGKASPKTEKITLVPYGSTNLRVTWFPKVTA